MTIYTTKEWKGFGKKNYYWNEYRFEDGKVMKYKCHRQKTFNGDENVWDTDEHVDSFWFPDDPAMPGWLRKYI